MSDPLSDVVALLQPNATFSKMVSASGPWRVRREESGQPFYCVVLAGSCLLQVDGHAPVTLQADDFVLIPAAHGFSNGSVELLPSDAPATVPIAMGDGKFRIGPETDQPDAVMLIGHCQLGSPDAALLVSLLPQLIHVRAEKRLATLVQLVGEESRQDRAARDVILARLLEVLFIEALRATPTAMQPGLVSGLADARLGAALRAMHQHPAQAWTVAQLAKVAALSRSTFFERFSRAVGVAPMEYLLSWRMALAKDLLRKHTLAIAEVAERVGYSSASTFSVAFARHVGLPPMRFARGQPARGTPADVAEWDATLPLTTH